MEAVRDFVPPPVGDVNPSLAGSLAQAIDRALDKDPARRGPGVEELVDLIEDALAASQVGRSRNLLRSYTQNHGGASAEPGSGSGAQQGDRLREAAPADPVAGPGETIPYGRMTDVVHDGAEAPSEPEPPREPPGPMERPAAPPQGPGTRRERRDRRAVVAAAFVLMALAVGAFLGWRWWVARHEPQEVRLTVDSSPRGASITVSGRPRGTTRALVSGLRPGAARIQLVLPGYRDVDDTVVLGPGPQGYFRALSRVEPLPFRRTYRVFTTPGYATVQIDGGPVFKGHPFSAELTAGRHQFHLVWRQMSVDRVLEYDVPAGDSARTLFLDYSTGRVRTRD